MFTSSSNRTALRVGTSVLLTAAVFVLPWWWLAAALAVSIVAFSWYIEAVFVLLFVDAVFAAGLPWLSIAALAFVLLVEGVAYYSFRA